MRQKVDSGFYNSASEVVREALRLMDEKDRLQAAKLSRLQQDIREGLGTAAGLFSMAAFANFHTFIINEIYSNADGTIQFIELREAQGATGQNFL